MTAGTEPTRTARAITLAGLFVPIVVSLVSLAGWVIGQPHLTGAGYIPVAPATGLAIFLLSIAAALSCFCPTASKARYVGLTLLSAVCLLSALALGCSFFSVGFNWESVLVKAPQLVNGVQTGRMSPFSAAALILAALSLLPQFVSRRWFQILGKIAGAVSSIFSIGVVLGYASGTPLFYGSGTIPMALLTALSLVSLNVAISARPLAGLWWAAFSTTVSGGVPKGWRRLVIVSVFAAGCIVALGAFYLRSRQTDLRSSVFRELSAIADLKADQISAWRRARLRDVQYIVEVPAITRAVSALAEGSDETAHRQELSSLLEPLLNGGFYASVAATNSSGELFLLLGSAPDETSLKSAREVGATGKLAISDFYEGAQPGSICMNFVLPVREKGGENSSKTVGVIVLRVDTDTYLSQLIKGWPTLSQTGETLLVRQEGDEVVFLNELRHQAKTALKLRRSVHELDLPAAMAVRGESGVREGTDYRGVRVLAAVRKIDDSPWGMVAKIDQTEVYAPLQRQALVVALAVLALLMGTAFSAEIIWRNASADLLKRELEMERQNRSLAERLALVTRHANDVILLSDDAGRIIEANERAVEAYGYSHDELLGRSLLSLQAPGSPSNLSDAHMQTEAREVGIFETIHLRRNGVYFPVEISYSRVEIENRPYRLSIIRDITIRREQEAEIRRLNRLHAALSQVNQAVVRAESSDDLFTTVCRVIAVHAKFRLVWIGERDENTHQVKIVARAGEGLGFLDGLTISSADTPEGQGPTGIAIREDHGCIDNDFDVSPRVALWRERIQKFGLRSAAAFPIRRRGRVWGSLTVYEAEKGFFRDKETALLVETADDISFAISRLDEMLERKRTEAALREGEDKYRALIETTGTGYVFVDLEGKVRGANQEYVRLSGHDSLDEILGRPVVEWTAAHDRSHTHLAIATCRDRGFVRNLEIDYVDRAGKITPVEINATVVGAGASALIISLCRDITERKRAEEERRGLELQMQQAQKLESLGVMAGGIAHDFNNLLTAILGHASIVEEDLPKDSPMRDDLQKIESAAGRAAELCQQMLAYAGKGKVVLEEVDLSRVVKELIHLLTISISKKASLECHLDDKVPLIEASPSQVRQVVMNLVINAAEAVGSTEGTVVVRTGVMQCDRDYLRMDSPIESPEPGQFVYVEVSDSGCGMDAATQARIFEPFFTTKFTGRGLGLAAVLGIVRSHHGSLKLKSAPGEGTTFRVLLPASRRNQSTVDKKEDSEMGLQWKGRGTILLVDDEEQVRTVTSTVLKRFGFNVVSACDGLQALDCFRQGPDAFACVVLDMAMPHMDGEETMNELRKVRPNIPIILVSGFSDRDIVSRSGTGGFTCFLEKPYRLQVLATKLREALSART